MEKLNILEIPLEIKLDARGVERHHDFNHLRTWTSIICRIEFVKTFPAFMKMTFITPKSNNPTGKEVLVLRINIPGLLVQLATSRTKTYSYGLFWKATRGKKCCAFLAFDTQFDFEQHIQWTKYWIKYLEYYRKDFLLNRRVNNDITRESTDYRVNESLASNINNTQNVKDIREILGPLPKVPESLNESWVRRQSRISGIYEEIGEFRPKVTDTSRDSIVSGVYEDMHFENDVKVDDNSYQKSIEKRKRVNTNEFGISRSNTNTEVDIKKKWWTLRGFAKRFDGPKTDSKTELDEFEVKQRHRQFKTTFQKSNRNSFSTPDLSHLPDSFINCHRGDLSNTDSIEFLNISFESISNGYSLDAFGALTISKRDHPQSNIFCTNSSSVNLLNTSDCSISLNENHFEDEPIYQVPKNIPIRLIDETTGYCIMGAPFKQDFNPLKPEIEDKNDETSHYLKMDEVRVELRKKKEEPIYANIEKKITPLRYSVEEKLPSYFPNEHFYQKPKMKPHSHTIKTAHAKPLNIYSPTPRKHNNISRQRKPKELNDSYENAMMNQIELAESPNLVTEKTPYYGTLPHQSTKSLVHKIPNIDAKNHFGSLPRFKKIDFSPLRVKLNNMFLRYNNGKI